MTIIEDRPMPPPIIRPARPDEYDEVARVWMNSWVSTGLDEASNFLLAKLRARVLQEIEKGWSLFVADDEGKLAAMLAIHLPLRYLDQLFVAPEHICRMKSNCAACAKTKRPGTGTSAKGLSLKKKRSNP
jgi:hypothetical protein